MARIKDTLVGIGLIVAAAVGAVALMVAQSPSARNERRRERNRENLARARAAKAERARERERDHGERVAEMARASRLEVMDRPSTPCETCGKTARAFLAKKRADGYVSVAYACESGEHRQRRISRLEDLLPGERDFLE